MSVDTLMANGASVGLARAISGAGDSGDVTAAGTTIADAASISATVTQVTGVASAGVQLPDKEGIFYIGCSAQNTLIYPHSTSGTINGGSAGAGYTITAGDGCILVRQDALNWVAIGETG